MIQLQGRGGLGALVKTFDLLICKADKIFHCSELVDDDILVIKIGSQV